MTKPNFLIIVADDLGFSDLGCFGGEIQTPNLDQMASEGLRMTGFHTAAACSPTRSMLLSGTDNHLAGVGAMTEWMDRPGGDKWKGKPGYEGYLSDSIAALPEILQDNGYHTILSGKWHLGKQPHQLPNARGFDRSTTMLGGAHNHYAYEPQFDRFGEEAEDLSKFAKWCTTVQNKKDLYRSEGEPYDPPANFPSRPNGYYSTETFTDQLLTYLEEGEGSDKPFFAYLAYSAPHWPLQAPRKVRDKYKGMYDDGPAALRAKRLESLKKMGLVPSEVVPHDVINGWGAPTYSTYTAEQRAASNRTMETFAAMVDCIDTSVGRVIDKLKEKGQLDNTFILFMSDNGAEGLSYEAIPILGPSLLKVIHQYYNNEVDNIGEPDSFVWYGNEWAQAATAPSRLHKHFATEGGIRVPVIVRYPPYHNRQNPGSVDQSFRTVMDIAPTILELVGVQPPTEGATFRGRKVKGMTGSSWHSWLKDGKDVDQSQKHFGWELHGRAAMRIGDWKINYVPRPFGTGQWELHNVIADPGETNNLRNENPEKFQELAEAWDMYRHSCGVIWGGAAPLDPEDDPMSDPLAWMKSSV